MFDFITRMQLERRGLSSGKRRRKVPENELVTALQEGQLTKILVFMAFSLAITGLILLARDPFSLFSEDWVEAALVINTIVITLVIQFYVNHNRSFQLNSRVGLVLGIIFVHLLLVKMVFIPVENGVLKEHFMYLLPAYAFAPMIMSILLGRNHGTFVAVYVSLLGAMLVPKDYSFHFMVISLICGFVAVYLTHQVRRRSRVVRAGFYVGLTAAGLGLATSIIEFPADLQTVASQCLIAILIGFLTAIVVSGILPLLEGAFRITTDISWIEMTDLNHPVLRRLSLEAPGTYNHSQMVAYLSEAAAESIGANATLCRVCAYFHDIGKLTKPQYFIENISADENPHDDLTPTMSALIIIAHVKDGIDLALKHKLNREIVDVIREHHGTTLVQYFYHRAVEQKRLAEEAARDGKTTEDATDVEKKSFRYPGPIPQSRESAIISLADGVESASRSIQKPNPQKLEQLIEEIIRKRLDEDQLDDSELTLTDLSKIQKSFHKTLCSMMHNRISYPKDPDKEGDLPVEEERVIPPAKKTPLPQTRAKDRVNPAKKTSVSARGQQTDRRQGPRRAAGNVAT